MSEEEKQEKKKKKQSAALVSERVESESFYELIGVLEELEKEGKYVDVQVCPQCKSPKVRRVKTMSGDLWGHMGILPVKFECEECGWRARLVLNATNKSTTVKDAAIMAEESELQNPKKKKS
jgi:ribosomal protein L37AE/L43A